MFFRLTFITFLFLLHSISFGQSYGTIKVITTPKNAIIKVDTNKLTSGAPKQLSPGNYKLKIWSSNRELFEKDINIVQDSTIIINQKLVFNNEYLSHLRALKKYKTKRFTYRVVPTAVFLGLTIVSVINVNNMSSTVDERYNRVIRFEDNYNNSIHLDDIEANRTNFYSEKEAYDNDLKKLNQSKIIMYSTVTISTAACWYFIRKSIKLEKPSYQDKTLLSNFDFNYYKVNGVNSFQLTYNF